MDTKGAVARAALHEVMSGNMLLWHEYEQWQCKTKAVGRGRASETSSGGRVSETFQGKTGWNFCQPKYAPAICFMSSYMEPSFAHSAVSSEPPPGPCEPTAMAASSEQAEKFSDKC